jgi:hypothetical protein
MQYQSVVSRVNRLTTQRITWGVLRCINDLIYAILKISKYLWRPGMSTLVVETHALAENVEFTDNDMVVFLVDGRKVIIPIVWFPRLANATKSQLENYELLGDGEGVHWPEIDEDLSVAGLLRGSH